MQPPNEPPAWTPMSPTGQQPWGQQPYGGGFGPQYPPPKQTNVGLIVGLVVGGFILLLVAAGVVGFVMASREDKTPATFTSTDGSCEVRVPSSWKKQSNLNTEAGIEIGNTGKEEYLIVLSEPKQDFAADMTIDGYAKIIIDAMKTKPKIKDVVVSAPAHVEVGGLPALQYDVDATVEYLNLHYLITFVDGKTHFHQIMTWSTKSRFSDNKQALLDATNSFREH